MERWSCGSGRLTIAWSKTDQEDEGTVVAITHACLKALDAIQPGKPGNAGKVFRISPRQMISRVNQPTAQTTGRETCSQATAAGWEWPG